MINKIAALVIICFLPSFALSQLSRGGTPLPVSHLQQKSEHIFILPSLPVNYLPDEDAMHPATRLKPYTFAWPFEVSLDPENSGKWFGSYGSYDIWQLKICSEGALSLGIIFDRYQVKEGVRIFLFNEDKSVILGALTSLNNNSYGSLAVSHIPGDRIILQMEVPEKYNRSYGRLKVGSVAHAYKSIFLNKTTGDWRYGLADTCHTDINCISDSAWQVVRRSVCRVVVKNLQLCTGCLINNARSDGTPYVYIAGHCFSQTFLPKDAVYYFNYESPECDGPDGSISYSISGSTKLTDLDSLDFALVELSDLPPDSFHVFYAGWDADANPPENSTCIHHPRGDVKKITFDYDPPVTSYHDINYYPEYILYSHWRILQWDQGTTQAGSSGSPLFNQDHQIIGSLTGGEADCVNKVDDYFTKFNYAWDYYPAPDMQLKFWLDPDNTGILSMDGFDPDVNSTRQGFAAPRIRVFPNPSTGIFRLEIAGEDPGIGDIRVFNLTGQLVYSSVSAAGNLIEVDLAGNPSGIYVIVISSGGRSVSEIISKQ